MYVQRIAHLDHEVLPQALISVYPGAPWVSQSGHFLHIFYTYYTQATRPCYICSSVLYLDHFCDWNLLITPLSFSPPFLSPSSTPHSARLPLSPRHPSLLVFHGFFTLFRCYWSSSKGSVLSWLQPGAGRERLWAKPALGERCKTVAVRWKQNESSESFSQRGTVFSTVPQPSMTFVSSGIRPLQPEGWIHPELSRMQSLVSLQTGCP